MDAKNEEKGKSRLETLAEESDKIKKELTEFSQDLSKTFQEIEAAHQSVDEKMLAIFDEMDRLIRRMIDNVENIKKIVSQF